MLIPFYFSWTSYGHKLNCTQLNSNSNHNANLNCKFCQIKESNFRGAKEKKPHAAPEPQVADPCS